MRIAYGIEIQEKSDPYVQIAEDTVHAMNEAATFGGMIFCQK